MSFADIRQHFALYPKGTVSRGKSRGGGGSQLQRPRPLYRGRHTYIAEEGGDANNEYGWYDWKDDTECALLVDKVAITAKPTTHSVLCSTTSTMTALWRMHETTVCLAWKVDGNTAIVIVP